MLHFKDTYFYLKYIMTMKTETGYYYNPGVKSCILVDMFYNFVMFRMYLKYIVDLPIY